MRRLPGLRKMRKAEPTAQSRAQHLPPMSSRDAIIAPSFGRACASGMPFTHQQTKAGKPMAGRKVTREDLKEAAEKYKNWGKWGPDDEIGTLNYTQAEDDI